MFSSYKKAKLRQPEVIEGENFIKCILPRKSYRSEKFLIAKEDSEIVSLFERVEEVSISEIIKALKMTRSTAGRMLKKLVASEILVRVGKGKSTRYRKK